MILSLILTSLLSFPSSHANDSVARISNSQHRSDVMKAQMDAIQARAYGEDKSCATLLAPLPVPQPADRPASEATTMPFAEATSAVEKMLGAIGGQYPHECVETLLQNLALISPTTASAARIMAALNELAPRMYGNNGTAIACEPPPTGIEHLLALARDANTLNECAPMAVGTWRKVAGFAPHGTPMNYSLVQAPDKVRVVLNIDFKPANPAAPGPVTPALMMERSRACMQAVSGLIKAPNGQPMEFDLLTPSEADRLPASVRPASASVTIEHSATGGYIRSHSTNYASDVGCPTIVHEVLHLVGLCDEYPGEPDGYTCRASPARNNLMSDTFEAFSTSVPRTVTCQCKDEECRSAMGKPGRTQFSMGKTFYEVTTPRFRNAYCQEVVDSSAWVDWAPTSSTPPKERLTVTLNGDASSAAISAASLIDSGDQIYSLDYVCNCPPDDQNCRRFIADLAAGRTKISNRSCPTGMEQKNFVWGGTPAPERYENGVLTLSSTPSDLPLLDPIHTRRIVGGTCATATPTYNECASRAYKTGSDCDGIPSHCLTPTPYGN